MDAFFSMLSSVAIFVALAVPGYLLVKTKTLKVEQSLPLSKLLMWVGMPFLILSSTLGLDLKNSTLLTGMGISLGITVGYVAVWFFILSKVCSARQRCRALQGSRKVLSKLNGRSKPLPYNIIINLYCIGIRN